MSAEGYVQVAADGAGKKIDAAAVTVPLGTVITASDGTTSTLTSDTVYYRQSVVLGDPERSGALAGIEGETGRGQLRVGNADTATLESIDKTLQEIRDMLLMALT